MCSEFTHLNIHSEFSLRDSVVRIPALISQVKANGMSAVALTDHMNLFAMVKFYRAAVAAGIKPIIGAELVMQCPGISQTSSVIVLCQNNAGYKQLSCLLTYAYRQGQEEYGTPCVPWSVFLDYCDDLMVLSGAQAGDIGQALLAGRSDHAATHLARWQAAVGDRFYLELRRCGQARENDYLPAAVGLAQKYGVPLVATQATRFLHRDDFFAHEARVCISAGWVLDDAQRPRLYSDQQYLTTPEHMQHLFADIPEAIHNANEIVKRCNVVFSFGDNYLPQFPVPAGQTVNDYFMAEARVGLQKQISPLNLNEEDKLIYNNRLDRELSVIVEMGFPGYFLIVADFIAWSKNNGVPVGPGRGSGAGSLVAYALGITALDPIEHELLFERFLNPERVSLPDFDIDFCMAGRDRVIDYVANRYGHDSVSQIITYGTMAARAVVRDVGRVLSLPYGLVDKIAKLVPFEIGMTLTKALAQEEMLQQRYEQEDEVRSLLDLAQQLEGLTRNAGRHAGGVVIAPSQLTDFTPLYCEAGGQHMMTQFDKDDVETIGLVKFDFLGLRTLTIIQWAVDKANVRRQTKGEPLLDIAHIPTDDSQVFDLLKRCEAIAIFQLESRGMRDLIRRLQPDCFDEIVALVALFRPGPLQSGMVDDFIDRKHGRQAVHYLHPKLMAILKPTYGVILYQEQVMQIAQVLSGYTLGGADLLRRAMGKKKPAEMAKQRGIFIQGAVDNQIAESVAAEIFDVIEKFAGYGFNKSHSAAYALLSYQTAWLKTHYPAEFMASVLSSDMDNTDKVVMMIRECERMGITVLSPDINISQYMFEVNDAGQITFGLGAVKGVGQATIEAIVATRKQVGVFSDLLDLCRRVPVRCMNRRALEPLVRSGACDALGEHRAAIFNSIERALKLAEQYHRDAAQGQGSLFDSLMPMTTDDQTTDWQPVVCAPWSPTQCLQGEVECLGYYVSGHPLGLYTKELMQWSPIPINQCAMKVGETALLAGIITSIRPITTKRGKRMAVIELEDPSGHIDVAIFSDLYIELGDSLQVNQVVVIKGEVSVDDYSGGVRVSAKRLTLIERLRQKYAKAIMLQMTDAASVNCLIEKLPKVIAPFRPGVCPLVVKYPSGDDALATLQLGEGWQVRPANDLLEQLRMLCGQEAVHVCYKTVSCDVST